MLEARSLDPAQTKEKETPLDQGTFLFGVNIVWNAIKIVTEIEIML
jgi:hypothetical protein